MDYRTNDVAVEQNRPADGRDRFTSYAKAMKERKEKEGKEDEKNA